MLEHRKSADGLWCVEIFSQKKTTSLQLSILHPLFGHPDPVINLREDLISLILKPDQGPCPVVGLECSPAA